MDSSRCLLYNSTFITAVVCLLLLPVMHAAAQELPTVDSDYWTGKYDPYFCKYTKRFFGVGYDWRWFKAQAIAESNLQRNAQSWVGAKGIMQIIPSTFAEIRQRNPAFGDITEPRWNIAAGVYYDAQQYRRWKDIPEIPERRRFMFGSYNAGRRTILTAQRFSRDAGYSGKEWQHIEAVAPRVPRWRHKETLGYIRKIHELMGIQQR